ncbi:hypothetical protein F5148DRAFT_1292077 [Russula earlei]|uniref:Uncharacterized protein n=1 Tax=Russula earlei TaxID=71964 RepID=A0ACC0TTQ5_9AGAM|nr:hypothetical protein F5148DRAFT_1292077 [Russula earlei]
MSSSYPAPSVSQPTSSTTIALPALPTPPSLPPLIPNQASVPAPTQVPASHTTMANAPAPAPVPVFAPPPIPVQQQPAQFQPLPPMANPAHRPTEMLGWQSDNAPRFRGRLKDSLIDFLHKFKALATGHSLNDAQKVQVVAWYVPPTVRDLWKTLDGYTTRDWAIFCNAL